MTKSTFSFIYVMTKYIEQHMTKVNENVDLLNSGCVVISQGLGALTRLVASINYDKCCTNYSDYLTQASYTFNSPSPLTILCSLAAQTFLKLLYEQIVQSRYNN